MRKIVFITNQMGTQGSYVNHLDLQQYLRDHENCEIKFYCENIDNLYETIKNTRRPYKIEKDEVRILKKEIVEPDVVVTDFKTLLMLNSLDIWIICTKLLVMDSIELTYHLKNMKHARFYTYGDVYKSLKHCYTKETIFLMPECNYKIFKQKYPDLNARIFYKNINIDMINSLNVENRHGYFYRWDDLKDYQTIVENEFGKGNCYEPEWMYKKGIKIPLKYNEIPHVFDYQRLIYRRRKYLEYQEQFGRLIFEYILLGKQVDFLHEPYSDDGLTDYLKHFDIKFDLNNHILTTKEELENKMRVYTDKPWEDN